jgi:hypothetical protein
VSSSIQETTVVIEVCTACGRRFFPVTPNEEGQCRSCLAHEFEEDLAREILRATAAMPPRRSGPSSSGTDERKPSP